MITLKVPSCQDEKIFIETMQKNQDFHFPFIAAPKTSDEFQTYLEKSKKDSEKYFIVWDSNNNIIGVFNVSGITQ
ncbi:Uncharacterised protein [Legionella maceachernii]|nr:ribosomal-protein-alanine N-acetyltransferase [Legionella maceachernii]SUP03641.1 Uncharacterised protein [Legionella maceachernii]